MMSNLLRGKGFSSLLRLSNTHMHPYLATTLNCRSLSAPLYHVYHLVGHLLLLITSSRGMSSLLRGISLLRRSVGATSRSYRKESLGEL